MPKLACKLHGWSVGLQILCLSPTGVTAHDRILPAKRREGGRERSKDKTNERCYIKQYDDQLTTYSLSLFCLSFIQQYHITQRLSHYITVRKQISKARHHMPCTPTHKTLNKCIAMKPKLIAWVGTGCKQ